MREARRGVPLVPAGETDCCARVGDRLDCSRQEARRWLTFLRALGLARESDTGFVRTDTDANPETLTAAFRGRVFGAREVLDALDDGPLDAATVADRTFDAVPEWERDRRPDPRAEWGERVERLLGWAVLFGLAESETDGAGDGRRTYRRSA